MDNAERQVRANAATAEDGARKRPRKRREQQRAIDTRRAILEAAIDEFAERGFEGASVRRIGERAGLEFTLITYHFRNKDALWRASCEHAFAKMEADRQIAIADKATPPAEALRCELRTLLRFTVEHSNFHQFMLRENQGSSPRLQWMVDTVLSNTMRRILPHIEAAQAEGRLIAEDPALLYYMLIGMVTAPSSLSGEMAATIGFSLKDPEAVERYWEVMERAVFR